MEAEDLVSVMEEARAAGKLRWIGISSTPPHMVTFLESGIFDAFQIPYSLLERAHENVIKAVAQAGAGTIIRGGVPRRAPEDGGLGGRKYWVLWEQAQLDELRAAGESRIAFLLRFALAHPSLHTTIVGTMNLSETPVGDR
jgi:aryl-alcohol dehydrogenase-like predicted oxidoreductase